MFEIPRIKCKRLDKDRGMACDDGLLITGDTAYQHLTCTPKLGRVLIGAGTCLEMANMNTKATYVLLEAMKIEGVVLRAFSDKTELDRFDQAVEGKAPVELLDVHINIYGPRDAAKDVGEVLSLKGFYLQDPYCFDANVEYHNPHIMSLDIPEESLWLDLCSTSGKKKASAPSDWNTVLDNIPQTEVAIENLSYPDADIVTTRLLQSVRASSYACLPLTGQAPDTRKEPSTSCGDENWAQHTCPSTCAFGSPERIWMGRQCEVVAGATRCECSADRIFRFRHAITKEEHRNPQPEPQGAILADDMGLGKTLTTISLIAVSLMRAARFAEDNPEALPSQRAQPISRSRATLIVLPSTRRRSQEVRQSVFEADRHIELMDSWSIELSKYGNAADNLAHIVLISLTDTHNPEAWRSSDTMGKIA
jgi:hypothetical protein